MLNKVTIGFFLLLLQMSYCLACEGFEEAHSPDPPKDALSHHVFHGRVVLAFYDPNKNETAYRPLEPLKGNAKPNSTPGPFQLVFRKSGIKSFPLLEGRKAFTYQPGIAYPFHGVLETHAPIQLDCGEVGETLVYQWELPAGEHGLPILVQTNRFRAEEQESGHRDFQVLDGHVVTLAFRCEHKGTETEPSFVRSWSLNGQVVARKEAQSDERQALLPVPVLASTLPGEHRASTPRASFNYSQLDPELDQVRRQRILSRRNQSYRDHSRLQWSDGTAIAHPEAIKWRFEYGDLAIDGDGPDIDVVRPSTQGTYVDVISSIPSYPSESGDGFVPYLYRKISSKLTIERINTKHEGRLADGDFRAECTAEILAFEPDIEPDDIRSSVYIKDVVAKKKLGSVAKGKGPFIKAIWTGESPSYRPDSTVLDYNFSIVATSCEESETVREGWFLDKKLEHGYP